MAQGHGRVFRITALSFTSHVALFAWFVLCSSASCALSEVCSAEQQHSSNTVSTVADNDHAASLWDTYFSSLSKAKYIDLSHVLKPNAPVWYGFAHPQQFKPAEDPASGKVYSYTQHGFEATSYLLTTDQYCTQLDPPAHWAPHYAAIDEIPPTYAVRPLVVINIADKVADDPGYHLQVEDIAAWERQYGTIPPGSVVMVRSDWYKKWDEPGFAALKPFPGVGLEALKFLHLQRNILFHGHEPLDTDGTPTLEGESWLLHNGYAQAEGVANLDKVAPKGCLINIGFPRFAGGTGGLARYVAICPPDWQYGVTVGETQGALPRHDQPLQWDADVGHRVRK